MDMHIQFGGGVWLVELVALIVVVAFWVLVLAALVLGVRWLIRADRRGQRIDPAARMEPLDVLRHRYANGEIDDEEFERRRKTLTGA